MIFSFSRQGKKYKSGLEIIKTKSTKIYYVYGKMYLLTGSAPLPITVNEAKRLTLI